MKPDKRFMHAYIIVLSIIIVFIAVGLMMLKYNVEGEKNLPFNIKQINIISTAKGDSEKDEEGLWYSNLVQKNDIYFYIEKNIKYKKQEIIKKVVFNNFQIEKKNDKGVIKIYRPKDRDAYDYIEEYIVGDSLEYLGAEKSDVKDLKINNQGGLIGFSVLNSEIGKYYFGQNEVMQVDGTLLSKSEVTNGDIELKLFFDIIIETESGNRFKANISIDLPAGNILEEGIVNSEITDMSKVIFKRF